ncbi:MAG: hypothetical protein JWO86_2936 [Myxococcaceae bacterium]|jgi:hypothetical protein|nr:hypothetical protein [Myxococcaceae bacterium]
MRGAADRSRHALTVLAVVVTWLGACATPREADDATAHDRGAAGCHQWSDQVTCLCTDTRDLERVPDPHNITTIRIADVAPAADLSVLARFPRLRELHIDGITPTQSRALAALSGVEILELRIEAHTGPVSLVPFGRMKALRVLFVWGFVETGSDDLDLTPLGGLVHLRTLVLQRMITHDLAPLGALTELEHLDLVSAGLVDLAPVANLPRLRYLLLRGSYRVADMTVLQTSKSLKDVQVVDAPSKSMSEEEAPERAPADQRRHLGICEIDPEDCKQQHYCRAMTPH